jgi:hypothetical protein
MLEQGNLYNELNLTSPPYFPLNWTSIVRTVDGFICPSNRKAVRSRYDYIPQSLAGPTIKNIPDPLGAADYRANTAAGFIPECTPDPMAPYNTCAYYENGTLFMESAVSFSEVTDGLSFTTLYGESLTGTWQEAAGCCVRTDETRTINRPILVDQTLYNIYWMSKHPGLVHFARCDGSVGPVNVQVDKLVLNALMTRNGGETLSAEDIK